MEGSLFEKYEEVKYIIINDYQFDDLLGFLSELLFFSQEIFIFVFSVFILEEKIKDVIELLFIVLYFGKVIDEG